MAIVKCKNANILKHPCPGSSFSREVQCLADVNNHCLANCSTECKKYEEGTFDPNKRTTSVWTTSTQQPPASSDVKISGVQASAQSASPQSVPTGGCGCSGGKRVDYTNLAPVNYV